LDDPPSSRTTIPIISITAVTEGDACGPAVSGFSPVAFTPFSGAVATGTDTGSDVRATIAWGDGTSDTTVGHRPRGRVRVPGAWVLR